VPGVARYPDSEPRSAATEEAAMTRGYLGDPKIDDGHVKVLITESLNIP
jgi:hypothetical protein